MDESTADGRYGASKRACEEILKKNLPDTELWLLRFGPIYGPGEEAYQKIAGTFLKKAMAGEDIYLRGDGSAVRHMVYVDDLCREIIRILKQAPKPDSGSHTLDIVNETPVTIRELADFAVEITQSSSKIHTETQAVKRSALPQTETALKDNEEKSAERTRISYREGIQQLYHYLKEQS